jgi:hypothetical protein
VQDELGGVPRSDAIEGQHEELSTPSDLADGAADGTLDGTDASGGVGVPSDPCDGASLDERRQLASDGLDLGELWHASRLAMASDPTSIVTLAQSRGGRDGWT